MSSFTVQIEENPIKSIQIETSIGNNPASIEVQTFDNNILEIQSGLTLAPSDIINLLNVRISQFLQAGSGVILSSGIDSLTINSTTLPHTHYANEIVDIVNAIHQNSTVKNILASSGISVSNNSGIYSIGLSNPNLQSSNILDFAQAVSGLLSVTDISSGSGISITKNGTNYTVAVTGEFGLTTEQVDDRISNLLVAGQNIVLNYNDNDNILTISTSGLQPSGNYSLIGHTHSANDITDFETSVSGYAPVKSVAGKYGNVTLNKNDVGLSNVDNTSDINKPISSGTQLALDNKANVVHQHAVGDITNFDTSVSGLINGIYAPLNSPSFSGTPTAPTAPSGTNNTQIANTQFVRTEISNLVNSAPSTLDTLNELAIALGNDPNFATTVASGLGQKANLSGATFTGSISGPSGNFNTLQQGGIAVSISGHTHQYTDIVNFASGVDATVSTLLQAGSYIDIDYNSINDVLTVAATGLQPSGNYSIVGHTHVITDIVGLSGALDNKQDVISNPVVGIGSTGHIAYWNSSSGISYDENQLYWDNSSNELGIGTNNPARNIDVVSSAGTSVGIKLNSTATGGRSYSFFSTNNTSSLGGGKFGMYDDTAQASRFVIDGSGNVGIGTNNPSYKLEVVGTGNFSQNLLVNGIAVSISGHTHNNNDITNFNSAVSGLLPVKDILGSQYIDILQSSGSFTISATGLQPSGNYSLVGHTHISNEITDFNSSVSGLLPVKDIVSGTYINVTNNSGIYTVNSTGEANLLETTVFNKTGSQIPKLSVVYINGGQGDQPTIALAFASGEMTSSKTYGITAENINHMSTGKVIVAGALTGVNTDQFNPTAPTGDINGTTLWLSPTVSGGLTTTKPTAPYHMVSVGTVVRTHQNQGVIEVRIQNGFELEELHNVAISGLVDNQFIKYDSNTSLWKNVTAVASHISDFSASVSGLLPVTDIVGGSNINIISSGSIYTISVSGSLGLTTEEVDDRVNDLLVAGTGIDINYDDNANTLTISTSGLQPSGDYSIVGHTHSSSDITDFNSSVSGLLTVNNITAGSGINITSSSGNFTINNTTNIINSSNIYLWSSFR